MENKTLYQRLEEDKVSKSLTYEAFGKPIIEFGKGCGRCALNFFAVPTAYRKYKDTDYFSVTMPFFSIGYLSLYSLMVFPAIVARFACGYPEHLLHQSALTDKVILGVSVPAITNLVSLCWERYKKVKDERKEKNLGNLLKPK